MPKRKKQTDPNRLPTYEVVIDPNDTTTGIKMVSILSDPAIEVQGQYFAKRPKGIVTPPCHFANPPLNTIENCNCDIIYNPLIGDHEWVLGDDPCEFCLENKTKWDNLNERLKKNQKFTAVEDEQIIIGPVLIPNKKIYRRDDDGTEYNIVFSPEVIKQLVEKFNRGNNNRSINLDHTNVKAPAFIRENWLVADSKFDKSAVYDYDLPVMSWVWAVKVEDKEFFQTQVKELGKHSFSMEGILGQKLVEFAVQEAFNLFNEIGKLSDIQFLNFTKIVESNWKNTQG